ncbi:HNH endonuclease [Paenibacillus tritici]|uniref:HNH endonuclease signature motif containing protein n=1 Tax=Paenibacillus tritici TaxID=1873425 RepID=UPI001BAE1D03|nr:HNH endonuclease [Paenibacillus tritici]QUL55436.1 HNH endonuclease [Paenibacillus tritici]
MTEPILATSKKCAYCHQLKPLSEFRRRTGKRSKGVSRRGACRECRKLRGADAVLPPVRASAEPALPERPAGLGPAKRDKPLVSISGAAGAGTAKPPAAQLRQPSRPERAKEARGSSGAAGFKGKTRPRNAAETGRTLPQQRGPKPDPQDASALIPSAKGMILMRGHSDKGRRWHQEIDLELAVTLVKEHAAIVVNRRTIRRLYSNKDFRAYILSRDNYTCYFCGLYGDTIDHLLPRAKGGHTTPDNCVCACNLCNQTKADQSVEQFMSR